MDKFIIVVITFVIGFVSFMTWSITTTYQNNQKRNEWASRCEKLGGVPIPTRLYTVKSSIRYDDYICVDIKTIKVD